MKVLSFFSSSSSSPTPTPLLTSKRILDDTSIAATTLSNGDRRLLFQDLSGLIRQAYYTSSTRAWRADSHYVVASDAKNYTPISVFADPSKECSYSLDCLSVFYILANNSLACKVFDVDGGEWLGSSDSDSASIELGYLSKYIAAADSRSLSSAYFSDSIKLVYEPFEGGAALLNASFTRQETD